MHKLFVVGLVIAFLFAAYFLNIYAQQIIDPRKSFARLLLYFLFTILIIIGLTYLMLLIIGWLFPQEIMK